jgi:protein tyrosine/serine phosphatase
MKQFSILLAGMSLVLSGLAGADTGDGTSRILNFKTVSPGIYRGGRPETAGMEALQKLGVKTDLNIDDDKRAIEKEAGDATRLGIKMISDPISAVKPPSTDEVNQILTILNTPSNYPIFLHCHYGEDRTGMVVGLYRVLYENWTSLNAYKEMIADGFHPSFTALKDYFDERTASHDE